MDIHLLSDCLQVIQRPESSRSNQGFDLCTTTIIEVGPDWGRMLFKPPYQKYLESVLIIQFTSNISVGNAVPTEKHTRQEAHCSGSQYWAVELTRSL